MNVNNVKVPKMPGGGAASALLNLGAAGLGVYWFANSSYKVDGGHRAILFNRIIGVKDEVYPEGTHFMVPWLERPIIFDVRPRPHLVESTAWSRDRRMVKIGLRVVSRPMLDKLPTIYQRLGENYNEIVLRSIIDKSLEELLRHYNATELITGIEYVSWQLKDQVTARALNFFFVLDDVSITTIAFGKNLTAAVEAKQVDAQGAEMTKFVFEKPSTVIRAQVE